MCSGGKKNPNRETGFTNTETGLRQRANESSAEFSARVDGAKGVLPERETDEEARAIRNARDIQTSRARRAGRQSTLLTDPLSDDEPITKRKTLLGQ